jgi:hypothetical protein
MGAILAAAPSATSVAFSKLSVTVDQTRFEG